MVRSGSLNCLVCEPGKSQRNLGQSGCDNCEYGKFKATSSISPCEDCAAGSYTSASTTLFTCAMCEVTNPARL